MKPPPDRPTPKVSHSETQVELSKMNVPESLAYVLKTIRSDIDSIKTQQNMAMGELYSRMENWRDDLRRAVASDIESALRQHIEDHHLNGEHS